MNGRLYIVSTPIGNLGDVTIRAIETLKQVDFILCEDTRVTSILLKHYNFSKPLVSFNAVTEGKKLSSVVERITKGENCALVSDSGTPLISDPGVRLVSEAIKQNINIVPVTGASALISALTVSGLPTDSFVFEGFLPQKKGRQKKLKELSDESRTIIIYESPFRIEKLIIELVEYMPERYVVVCRELTKKFEETWRGYPKQLKNDLDKKTIKGEFVVVIAPKGWKIEN
ncbi:16S rRNA (cytidine(1402)-2'-O)-methyltransferase [bacterium BMS3Abin03]|jgi:16S rRNA (cytidine1402-2'-O)-methyltransferase|nr:16S rRNA (cytidine(1402)-2'-O)-methyltransferase [bacterium BMS3Abin03]MCG6960784.1 16S rRNA (cytidine(1402)-2'-O)-methyltransferase [bacterium BMS3Abin03]